MKFPYQIFRGSYYPIIPIVVTGNGKNVNTSCVVDSGASISIFQGGVARLLGIDMEAGEKRVFQGASAKLIGYIHKVRMAVAGEEIDCTVAFSDELSTSFNLMGRRDVFGHFKVCFDETEKSVDFIAK